MIRRRATVDDGHVHIWVNDATENADRTVCGLDKQPSPDESGQPCLGCVSIHATDLIAKLDEEPG